MPGEQTGALAPLIVFYSYAHKDERFRRKLEKHLSLLRQQGLITEWHDRQIMPGTDWASVIDTHLMTAQVILLLISPDFLASDYCYGVEMQRALERHAEGSAQVIPILLRPVDWESAPFAFLQCLPRDGRPITQWKNQDEALVTVAQGLRTVVEQIYTPVTLPLSPAPLTPRAPSLLRQRMQPSTVTQDRHRQRMLESVRMTWITGVLEHSLHDAALIALGLHEEPGALANPWRLVVQEVDHPAQPLPAGTRITEVYDDTGGALLILGEPGVGKTTLLLELARELLTRAQADEREPIPVVFNLSSWAQKRAPLADWLVEELYLRYQVSRTLGQTWADNDQLLLLLDGLDEVPAAQRGACIQAINSYRQAHPLVSVVVCSRRADYLNQTKQLGLQRAVVVQPLTPQQIDVYLASAGEQVAALRVALRDDPVLQELATTPLMLNILILAYQEVPLGGRMEGGSAETRQEQLFASYVQHMLKRRRAETSYTAEQATHWLSHLAGQMRRQSQTVFYLEQMQPTWFSGHRMLRVYDWLAVRLPGMLMGVLVSLSISMLIFGGHFGLLAGYFGLPIHIPGAFLGGLLGALLSEGSSSQLPAVNDGKARSALGFRLLQWLLIGALIGIGSGLGVGLAPGGLDPLTLRDPIGIGSWLGVGLLFGLGVGLAIGLCSILLLFLLGRNNTSEMRSQTPPPARGTTWQRLIKRREVRNGLIVGLSAGLSFGLGVGLSAGLSYGLGVGRSYGQIFGLVYGQIFVEHWGSYAGQIFGLGNGLICGLTFGTILGVSAGVLSVLLIGRSATVQPTDLLVLSWRSLRKGLFSMSHVNTTVQVTILIGLSSGLSFGLSYGLIFSLSDGLSGGLGGGLGIGLGVGLSYWLLLGLFRGVSGATIEDQRRVVPNQGIHRSARNGLVLGLISAVIVGLLGWLSFGLSAGLSKGLSGGLYFWQDFGVSEGLSTLSFGLRYGLSEGLSFLLSYGLIIGLCVGLVAGLHNGGLASFRHYVVRFLLWRTGAVPWRYVPFLDYAAERILLRKVGAGYIFIHRLLLDYFASLETIPAPEKLPAHVPSG